MSNFKDSTVTKLIDSDKYITDAIYSPNGKHIYFIVQELDDAAVWIYSKLLLQEAINQDRANAIMQTISMKNASNLLKELVTKALDDANQLVAPDNLA